MAPHVTRLGKFSFPSVSIHTHQPIWSHIMCYWFTGKHVLITYSIYKIWWKSSLNNTDYCASTDINQNVVEDKVLNIVTFLKTKHLLQSWKQIHLIQQYDNLKMPKTLDWLVLSWYFPLFQIIQPLSLSIRISSTPQFHHVFKSHWQSINERKFS